jgi:mRNA interferase MazF
MNEGDVTLAALVQADGAIKNRPVILLRQMPRFGDFLVCGISTQLNQMVADFDDLIQPHDADFASSGLKASSLIRLGFLAAVPQVKLLGSIGNISPERHYRLLARLSHYLNNDTP